MFFGLRGLGNRIIRCFSSKISLDFLLFFEYLHNYMNHLSDMFYTMPGACNTTMTRKQLKETLLATDGWVLACGHCWDIKSKHLGAGVYKVFLKKKND